MIADAVKAHRFVKALWAACEKEIIMTISEKVAYLKGLAEGLDLDTAKSKEGKLISVMIGILEEIGMYEDAPEDLCAERLAMAVYKGRHLGRPILGKASTLEHMTGESLRRWQREHYVPGAIVAALAGSFEERHVDALTRRLSALPEAPLPKVREAVYLPAVTVRKKAIEQNHLTLAFPGLSFADPRRFQLQLLSSILGGGMSSRLFQQVREQKGLCYSIYSYGTCHDNTGYFGVYTALGRETEGQALDTILAVIREPTEHGVTQAELDRAREQSKANVLMGLESTQSHMSSLGRGELLQGEVLDEDAIIAAYDAVTRADVQALAGELFRFENASLSAVGRVGSADAYRALLH